jgi:NAD(P)H-dependent flavin oxidoreductase YrpB (nitropropane dioxygenase family)
MKSPICEMLGIDFPLLAFSHCRDVVAAVSRAGGMGVFGAVNLPPARLREELTWIDAHCGGKPYGVDLIVPNAMEGKSGAFSSEALLAAVPQVHKDFASGILTSHGVEPGNLEDDRKRSVGFARNMRADGAASALEVAFQFPIRLIANALGVPPREMLERGKCTAPCRRWARPRPSSPPAASPREHRWPPPCRWAQLARGAALSG